MEDTDIDSYAEILMVAERFFLQPDIPVIIGLVAMLVLIACSALISGSEIAFFSLGPNQLNVLRATKSKSSQLIINLLDRPKRLLATILIANNFVNVAIVILSSFIISKLINLALYPLLSFLIQVVVVASLLLILGEIIPKIYSSYKPLKFAEMMARPLKTLISVFYPLSSLLVRSTTFIDKRMGRVSAQLSMSELSEAFELTSENGAPEEERKILKGIVKFGDIDTKEIMKSRVDVTAVDVATNYMQLLEIILDAGYSRIPAYQDHFDRIIGILYVKDLLPHLDKGADFEWAKLLRPAFFVPENKKISDLLQEFQQKKIHMAVVVDEYGGTSGIVTLEDIIEEIVGDISDEFDTEEDEISYKKLDDSNYLFEGKTLLNDLCKILEIDDRVFENVKGDSETLAGLILELEGKIPKVNESTKFQNFEFKIRKVDNRRIEQIHVKILNK